MPQLQEAPNRSRYRVVQGNLELIDRKHFRTGSVPRVAFSQDLLLAAGPRAIINIYHLLDQVLST